MRVLPLRLRDGLEEVDGQSAIYVALEVCSWATRGVDCVLERHLGHGPSAFLYTPEQIKCLICKSLQSSSKVMCRRFANACSTFCSQYSKQEIRATFRNFNFLKKEFEFRPGVFNAAVNTILYMQ